MAHDSRPTLPPADARPLPEREVEQLAWWQQHQTFEQSVDRPDADPFTFYEGPPTANGRPGIHHVMARTVKDAFCRYKTLKGYRVERKAGWDTHGLPVEIEVEKALGLEGRHQVEEYGIARYNAECRTSVLRYKDLWDTLTQRMGYWVDLDAPYVTFENEYIESVWHLLKRLFDKGLLYEGYKIQWYSPANGTVLSSHEVSLGYKEVQDPSIYVKARVAGEDDTFLLAWTTTPWTTPSNTLMAVGEAIDYVTAELAETGERLILARERLSVLGDAEYRIVHEQKGSDLIGLRYHPFFDWFEEAEGADRAWRVVAADYVTTSDGTGIVHSAPAFGADDYATGQAHDMPLFNPVEPDGTFSPDVPLVGGMWFKDADKVLARDLRDRGLLFRHETYLHNYPHDWRKGTPLLSYPVRSWFVRTTDFKDRLVELNETIGWHPPGVGTGRMGEWLRGNVDWALSRSRYWGTPLPIWQSDRDPEQVECIGSIAELESKVGGTLPAEALGEDGEIDLHRPYVDAVTWPDGQGGTMRRVPDLIDVWFDSGAMPFAQWHYPFENEERFRQNFPADFIAEGVDQTRGWFYTLHAIAVLLEDSVAYRNVVVNGLVLDAQGEKMSKSKGNAVDPFATLDAYGADVVRWYMMSNAPPWENLRFDEKGLRETRSKFFGTLENVYAFLATYAGLDRPDWTRSPDLAGRPELDRWIVSRLHGLYAEADDALAAYNPTRAARAAEAFADELSNWYLRRSRRRFWKPALSAAEGANEENGADKQAAYHTVHTCLLGLAHVISPIAPFFADELYRKLAAVVLGEVPASVHLSRFPQAEDEARDLDLERRMGLARLVSSLVLRLRNEAQIGVRQPLARILVVEGKDARRSDIEAVKGIILDEVNVKAVEYVDAASDFVSRSVTPNFRILGKRLGAGMKAAAARIKAMTDDEIDEYVARSSVTLDLDGTMLTLGEGDLVVASEGVEGWLVASEAGATVALDTALSPDLVSEGLAREVVNRIQNLRKDSGLDVSDRIALHLTTDSDDLRAALDAHRAYVYGETLATSAHAEHADDIVSHTDVHGHALTIRLRRGAE
jgi:isoleucyl-tRNA synthetase